LRQNKIAYKATKVVFNIGVAAELEGNLEIFK